MQQINRMPHTHFGVRFFIRVLVVIGPSEQIGHGPHQAVLVPLLVDDCQRFVANIHRVLDVFLMRCH